MSSCGCHPVVIDSVTALQTESTNQRALRCESMARQELETMTIDAFHTELRLALTSYYEGILKMEGASGVVQKLAYKRQIKRLADAGLDIQGPQPDVNTAAVQAAAAGEEAAAAAAAPEPAPAAAAAALAAAAAAPAAAAAAPAAPPPAAVDLPGPAEAPVAPDKPAPGRNTGKGRKGVVNKHDWCA
jgi:hypothetical protein